MRKLDTTEQMYGVAEPASSKVLQTKTSHVTQLPNHKKEKLRKKQKVEDTGKVDLSIPEHVVVTSRKKKASVRPYQTVPSARSNAGSVQYSSLLVKHGVSPSELHVDSTSSIPTNTHRSSNTSGLITSSHPTNTHPTTSTHPTGIHPSSVLLTNVQLSTAGQVSTPIPVGSKEKRKVKKQKKRRNSEVESEGTQPQIKPRPDALNIPETASTPVQSDAPDTGDVHYMLQELLHPPPVSLVTPIPTPNTVKPFIFPTPVSQCFCNPNTA